MAPLCGPTTRQVIAEAERTNALLGHDNLGSLSTGRGFIPLKPPRLSFESSHAAWDAEREARELSRVARRAAAVCLGAPACSACADRRRR